jgi:regulator of protease activity HflC (stomatin/prohibitin superfamily)
MSLHGPSRLTAPPRDTVPVDVDAVIFWQVHDTERAALEISNYREAIAQVAQTSLREMIGATELSALLSERKKADQLLREEIGAKTAEWGVGILSVEIRDVGIPSALQDAMSRRAQAEREKEARIILGSSEQQIAQTFVDAANIYATSPGSMQLRAMNLVYEATKESLWDGGQHEPKWTRRSPRSSSHRTLEGSRKLLDLFQTEASAALRHDEGAAAT